MHAPTPSPRVRRFKKRWILLGFLLCPLLAWSALQHPRVRAHLHARVAVAIGKELGLEADLGPVTVEFPLRLVGGSIRLTHPQHGLLASASRVVIQPSFGALLRGRVQIAQLQIEGAYVRLRVQDGRIVNLPTLPLSKTGRVVPERVPLEEVIVHRARLVVDATPGPVASMEHLNLVARVSEGTRASVLLSVGQGYVEHANGSERVSSIALEAHLAPDAIELRRLRVRSNAFDLSVRDGKLGLPAAHGRYRADVELRADMAKLLAWPHGLELPPIDGKVFVRTAVDGAGSAVHTRGHVQVTDGHIDGFGLGVLELNVEATPAEVLLLAGSEGRIVQNGGVVGLEGRLGLTGDLPIAVQGDVSQLEFHKLMAQLDVTQDCLVNWVLRGGFKIRGTLDPVAVTGPVWADHVSFKALTGAFHDPTSTEVIGTPPGHVAGRVTIRKDALRFENLHGRLPHSDIFATVHIGFDDALGVTAYGDHLDLADTSGIMGMPLTGAGKFRLDVGGTYSKPTLTGALDLQGFSIDGFRVGDIKTRAELERGGLAVRFRDTAVTKNASHYVINDLLLDFTEHFAIDGSAHVERLALADFYDTVLLADDPDFQPYQGVVSGAITARYTRGFEGDDADGTLAVAANLDVGAATLHGLSFERGRVDGTFTWRHISDDAEGIELVLSEVLLAKGAGAVRASGRMDLGAKLKLTVMAEELSLVDLHALPKLKERVAGELNALGVVGGTLAQPLVELDAELLAASIGERALGDLRTYIRLTHRDDPWVQVAAQWDPNAPPPGERCTAARIGLATATWQDAEPAPPGVRRAPVGYVVCGQGFGDRLALDLVFGVGEGTPVRGTLDVTELPAAWLFPPRRRGEDPVTGSVSAHVDLRGGRLAEPDTLQGRVSLGSLRLGLDQAWIESDGPVVLRLTGRGASIQRMRLVGNGSVLEVEGGASLATGLQVSLHGDVDLSALSALAPGIAHSTGRFTMDVKVTGDPAAPSVYGHAVLTGGTLLLEGYPQALEKVSASIAFSEREALLERFDAELAGGKVSAHGSVAIGGRGLDHYDLFLTARDLSIEPYGGVELALSADTRLSFHTSQRLPRLTGTVRLLRARYKRPFSLGITERLTGFSQAKRVVRETYDPALDHMAIDLKIVDDAPLRIANNLLSAELRIEDSERPFRIVGTDQRIGVLGTLALTRGTLRFRSSQFSLEQGTVSFDDEHRVRPRLDVHARTEFRRAADASGARWLIDLHAVGETDSLKIETSSDPALAQEDIALLLTVGLTRAEAERLGTGSLTEGAALEALATVSGLDREVKRALPLIDDFNVTSAYSARTNRTEPQIVVGKRLSESVRASATTGLSADSNFKTGVEWRLGNQTSVEAAYDNVQTTTSSQFGNVGLDLRWRLEFD